jgi:CheY-like chemotaxis protein
VPGLYLLLRVTDTGAGIPVEAQARIFEPFYTSKPQGKGTGMGLAAVDGIVAENQGFIELDSTRGQGSSFTICLPAAVTAAEPELTPASGPERATILLVEDADALRQLAALTLSENGYRVLQASNGRDALALVQHHHGLLDLLITDVVMPHMAGPELAQRLQSLRPGLGVLFLSGYNDSRLISAGIEHEQVELLTKPFAPQELSARVATLIAAARTAAQT